MRSRCKLRCGGPVVVVLVVVVLLLLALWPGATTSEAGYLVGMYLRTTEL